MNDCRALIVARDRPIIMKVLTDLVSYRWTRENNSKILIHNNNWNICWCIFVFFERYYFHKY